MPGFGKELPADAVAELREVYLTGARQDLQSLGTILDDLQSGRGLWPDCLFRLREVVHNIKGQGTSFGFPLMTEVGESLHHLLQRSPGTASAATLAVLSAHVACLNSILTQNISGDAGAKAKALVARLRTLTERVTKD